ncbi:FecR family protein [Algihabitans albus]|uniref:FecR family protein n=1 Tax=Algihabitans albus TaxID=2164067 RepID=UPI001F1FDCA1|nr:FecR domain-containing protein [Algihabitans albus]
MALAASFLVVLAVGVFALAGVGPQPDYDTEVGEHLQVDLADGSRLHLNTGSSLSVDFTGDRRRVLLHSGEVYFEISADPERPFVVDAGFGTATALGTSFSVRRHDRTFDVVVTSSRVEVSGPDLQPTVVAAGEGVGVAAGGVRPFERSDIGTSLAWRSGRLVFDETSLDDAFRELDRYRRGRIVIVDASIAEIPVTGAFSITRVDAVLETIEETLPVRLVRLGDRLTFVFADPPS